MKEEHLTTPFLKEKREEIKEIMIQAGPKRLMWSKKDITEHTLQVLSDRYPKETKGFSESQRKELELCMRFLIRNNKFEQAAWESGFGGNPLYRIIA
ncbi:MAG: hypothetical protein KAI71_04375 [Candidatus Pacebacteria bacterium]|nr:hypothetical protein [Candidatus Paceibacterota bacterium]